MQLRKNKRSNHWKAIISKEIATVFAIVWYIKVELLRTKQLPPYITYTQIDKVPELRRDVHQQASSIYSRLYRSNDKASKFHVADTKQKNLDGKVGTISSYDTDKSCYIVQVSDNKQGNSINSTELYLSPEYMEPCSYATLGSVASSAAYDSCQVNIKNHFASTFPHAPPSLTFWPCVFSEIGGHSHTPHMEGDNERTKLMTMLEKKEIIVNSEAKQLQEQQLELEKGLSKMYSTRQPVQKRPRTIIQQKKIDRVRRATNKLNAFGRQEYNMPFPNMDRNEIILERKKTMNTCLLFHLRQQTILCIHVAQILKNFAMNQKAMIFLILFMDKIISQPLSL